MRAFGVFIILLIPFFAHAGVFDVLAGFVAEAGSPTDGAPVGYNVQNIHLLRGVTNADPNALGGGDVIVDEGGALIPAQGPAASDAQTSNGEISAYVVRDNDSLSEIADMFGVSVNTILWANKIDNPKTIQPGDTLIILPVSGVRHIVRSGDTLKSIATKYHGDVEDIMTYNQLASDADLSAGTTVVIPGGEVVLPAVVKKVVAKAGVKTTGGVSVAAGGNGFFRNPVPGSVRTQGIHGYNGVDLAAPNGTAVHAAAAGTVILSRGSGYNGGYGNYIVVKHGNGTQTLYAHLSSNAVSAGESVVQGQTIGAVGNTGRSTGSHLHLEVRGAKNPF